MGTPSRATLEQVCERMAARFGHTGWWPGDTPFEIAIGAILTQNTAWVNVEKAIINLKAAGLLDPFRLLDCTEAALEDVLRPSGFFRVKARRVRSFCEWLDAGYGGDMERLAAVPLDTLRPALLAVGGIGPETCDDILLYACGKPVFVVDAYTRRIFSRHGWCAHSIGYENLRALFERRLPADVALFREYHGLIVYTGKEYCRPKPRCAGCPLEPLLGRGQPCLHAQG
jgi:endonuclease III related protein